MALQTNEEKISALRDIEELDVDAGLKVISNLVGAYLRVLGILIKMDKNDEGKFDDLLSKGELEQFRTMIHGYKSALANVGALGLSDEARNLEMAAINGDRAFIDANINSFKDGVSSLTGKLKEILGEPQ